MVAAVLKIYRERPARTRAGVRSNVDRGAGRIVAGSEENKPQMNADLRSSAFICGFILVIDPHGLHDRLERVLEIAFVLWRDRDHIEELSVAQLRRDHAHRLRSPSRFIYIAERREERVTPGHRRALKTAVRAQVVVALSQTVDKLLRGALQVAAIRLRHTETRAMREESLPVVLPIRAFRHEPHRVVLVNLTPVVRHTHRYAAVEDRVTLVTRRRIGNTPGRRVVWVIIIVRVVAGSFTNRITLPGALYLSH